MNISNPMMVAAEAVLTETRETVEALSLSSPMSSWNEPPCRGTGREFSSSQGHDSGYQGASLQETSRLLGERESLRGGVRG